MGNWKNNLRQVIPYTPGEQPKRRNLIKLNTNENPYPPSKKVQEMMQKVDGWRLYPDPAASKLVQALADYHGLEEDQIFVGVGSDDVLAIAFMTCFNSEKPIFFPDITYSFYDVWADLFQIPYETKPLNDQFEICIEDYKAPNGGIIFPNPNAPTGVLVDLEFIEEVLEANKDSVVIIDEAYIDFGGVSAKPLLEKYENLLVVQTYSKSRSLAGIRIGYAMGNKELIKALHDVKYSFNSYTMNQPSILIGSAVLEDEEYFQETKGKIINTREWFKKEMKELGFSFADSKANFVFATHESAKAEDIFEAAKKQDIFVRYFKKPRIDNYLRITIGTDEEMKSFVAFIKDFLNHQS